MRLHRVPILLVAVTFVAAAPAEAATVKLKGGTTTLTFGQPALTALSGMGIGFSATAPATLSGTALKFPIKAGKVKVSGKKVTGTINHGGGMTLSNPTLAIGLSKPAVVLAGAKSALNATALIGTSPIPLQMATLDMTKAKTKITSKRITISGVHVKLTQIAASSMNAGFNVTGFTTGFEIGTATLQATVKH